MRNDLSVTGLVVLFSKFSNYLIPNPKTQVSKYHHLDSDVEVSYYATQPPDLHIGFVIKIVSSGRAGTLHCRDVKFGRRSEI